MAAGFFETVIEQSNKVLEQSETKPPADVALYSLGEVYSHHAYEGKDYELARQYFIRLIENFPDSTLTSEAQTFVSLFDTFKAKEEDIASKEQDIASKEKRIADLEKTSIAEKHDPVVLAHKIGINKNFETAVKKNTAILKNAGKNPPGDAALYNLGLIYANIENPSKDYKKSQAFFKLLIKDFPGSPLADEAKVWLGLFEVIEKMQQIDIDIEQQKKQLSR